MADYDFIIIGAGINGLALGALLSKDGARVLVLEKSREVGGRAWVQERGGFRVDYGMHLVRFGKESVLSAICSALGHTLKFHNVESTCLVADGTQLEIPARGASQSMNMFAGDRTLEELKRVSVQAWMDEKGMGRRLRRLFTATSATLNVNPFVERSSVGELLLNLKKVGESEVGAAYPVGGWQPIFRLFRDRIGKNGQVRTATPVESITVQEGRAVGVRIREKNITADRVISAIPCQELFNVLDEKLCPSKFIAKCRGFRPTSGIVLDYGISGEIAAERNLWCLWDPLSYGFFPSNFEPRLAPPGHQLLTWFYPLEKFQVEDEQASRGFKSGLEEAIFALFPALPERIKWSRSLYLPMVDGAEVSVDQIREDRPEPIVPGVEGLFLVGDSIGGEGAGGDIGHNSVVQCYLTITGKKI
ncbi:MAG: NAD(P)/FAD-dependent oxidoreductase [bacterium]|nr:NAD(P)/FAD-dependent oxidoreductase [bacterium]